MEGLKAEKGSKEQEPAVQEMKPSKWEAAVLAGDEEALRQLHTITEANKERMESEQYGNIEGVDNTIDRVIDSISEGNLRLFLDRLDGVVDNLLKYATYIREKASEKKRTEFFVLAYMTGELENYYKKAGAQSEGSANEIAKPDYYSEVMSFYHAKGVSETEIPDPEFEFPKLGGDAGLMKKPVYPDDPHRLSRFTSLFMDSHQFIINLFFDADQKLRTPEDIVQIAGYAKTRLEKRFEDAYHGN